MNQEEKTKLENLGYNDVFEENRNQLGFGDFLVARVTAEFRGGYTVRSHAEEYPATVTGKQMFSALSREDYPAVGDWVVIDSIVADKAVIRKVLPRQTIIKRKKGNKNRSGEKDEVQVIATNIDVAFIVESIDRDYSLNRFERYLAIAESGGVKSVIIINKIDLVSGEELEEKLSELKTRFPGVEVILTSTISNEGLEDLKKYIVRGKTYCFLGSSGVGKSSLINKLLGENAVKTGDIGMYSGRGRHITTSRQMYFLKDGGIVIDNPGIREVGMTDVSSGVDNIFEEIISLAKNCKFADCAHVDEPGCAVLEAVKSGTLDEGKYRNYIGIKKEVGFYELSALERRRKDKSFGKFVKSAKKSLRSKLITDN